MKKKRRTFRVFSRFRPREIYDTGKGSIIIKGDRSEMYQKKKERETESESEIVERTKNEIYWLETFPTYKTPFRKTFQRVMITEGKKKNSDTVSPPRFNTIGFSPCVLSKPSGNR